MNSWHCGTTHCLAGWIITLAKAQELEGQTNTPTAAALILKKSCPENWPLPNFYCTNEGALAFIKKMSTLEKSNVDNPDNLKLENPNG
jgi:hypothetical protein